MTDKIVEGGWYKDRSMFIHVVKIMNENWSEIHVMMLRDGLFRDRHKFLHEWTKQQFTPGGNWPISSIFSLPEGPPQEILDALEWPSDGRGYRALPRKKEW
jgi:hypothetical protein